jgi:predicted dehydrogenase
MTPAHEASEKTADRMSRVKVGVIGVGYLGQFHAEKYAASAQAELVGVVDPDSGRGRQVAEKLHADWYPEPSQLIGRVDAVSIVVPTALHHQVALPFLRAGVHVFLEKPITVTLEQADELIVEAEMRGLTLQIGHIERFNPAITSCKPMLRAPRYIVAERAAPFTVRCTDVNVVLDLMIHDLDIVMDLAGSEPREVSAAGASIITNETDIATARIVFRNGCIADVTASRVSNEKKRLMRVFDGDGLYACDFQAQSATLARPGRSLPPELVPMPIPTERRDTLNEEIHAFLDSVRIGRRPLVSGREGRRALALARLISDCIVRGIPGFVPAASTPE